MSPTQQYNLQRTNEGVCLKNNNCCLHGDQIACLACRGFYFLACRESRHVLQSLVAMSCRMVIMQLHLLLLYAMLSCRFSIPIGTRNKLWISQVLYTLLNGKRRFHNIQYIRSQFSKYLFRGKAMSG